MASSERLVYPRDLGDPDRFPAWINFSFFKRRDVNGRQMTDKIDLYMPESAENPSTVSWSTEDFGFVGNAIAATAKRIDGSGFGGITQDVINMANNQAVGLIVARGAASLGSSAAGLLGGDVTAEGLMGVVAGKIPNPYLTMVFKGVDFRSFSFVFKFFPFSEEDCAHIYKIINTFRKNILPGKGDNGAFLTYPMECDISYKWGGAAGGDSKGQYSNRWLHKFKTAYCTAFDVNYTNSGMFSVMRNGFPSEITVAMKWSERSLVTAEDIITTPNGESY